MIDMDTTLQMAEESIACLRKQKRKYQWPTWGMGHEAEDLRNVLCCVLKQAKYLNHVVPLQSGAVQIRVTYQILAEGYMRKRKDIIGDMLDLICV